MNSGLALFTAAHVLISLVAIGTGFVAAYGMLTEKRFDRTTSVFLWTTLATSVTGFFFPFHKVTPAHVFGVLSLIVLVPVFLARTRRGLAGGWRTTYVIGSLFVLYLNTFVLVVQAFLKIPALNALAPTQTETPFKAAQGILFVLFLVAAVAAVKRFRPVTATA